MSKKLYDVIVVGAGLSGAVAAYEAAKRGCSVLVIEKSGFIGGLCSCYEVDGVPVHAFGPHIFHTDKNELWDFVSNKCELIPYKHVVNAMAPGYKEDITLPINLTTIEQIYGKKVNNETEALNLLANDIVLPFDAPTTLESKALSVVGKKIYEALIRPYSTEQWCMRCDLLPAEILDRLKIRMDRDDRYFGSEFVGIPAHGWGELFNNLLKDCDVLTNTDYLAAKDEFNSLAYEVIYTGKIDEYFNNCFGALPYINHHFEDNFGDYKNWNHKAAVINNNNHVSKGSPIRMANYAQMYGKEATDFQHIVLEYPERRSTKSYMYPVPFVGKNIVLDLYRALGDNEKNVTFVGRNAEYKYYDMDDCILRSKEAIKNVFARGRL